MLQNNANYPFPLKRRIMSENGHLSNNACAEESEKLINSRATRFILAHLSKENNLPIIVFNMDVVGNLRKVLIEDAPIGTLVY